MQTLVINLWSVSTAEHLQHVWYWIVLIGVYLAVVVLSVHDDHEVS